MCAFVALREHATVGRRRLIAGRNASDGRAAAPWLGLAWLGLAWLGLARLGTGAWRLGLGAWGLGLGAWGLGLGA
ncbi:hypothetical protein D7S99_05865 [Burkholderia cepacia]|nr:hypothetical protein [Burkholderia cepacia]MBB0084456.1 hypothetical protein [Burkholderia cepacia]